MRSPIPQREQFACWCVEKLRNADTDQFHHVNNAVMATFFEAGRMELFRSPDVASLMGQGALAVVRLLMNFHRELFYPGQVSIGSQVVRVGERSFEIAQGLFDEKGCVASAEATCVLMNAGRAEPIAPPLRELLLRGGTTR